jgi:tRNA A-37 threonylcarbamoyl transferase component Bud32
MAEGDQAPRRYDLLERVAVGGMAEIFRAKATGAHGFEKILAIKRILPDLASDPEFENRFIAEAKLAVALTHANVVQIFDFGRFSGSLYIAMEYVDGPDLGRYFKGAIEHAERVPLGAAMHIAMEMCKGLDVAHARRIVHSDISPSNILLSRMGEVKIADFGIARAAADASVAVAEGAARDGRVMGKWPYMSPEQTRGEPLDARSDLFSAAVVLYELFTSTTLFRGRDVKEIVANVRGMPIPAPSTRRASLPPALDDVLGRALERDPARRYQQASELLRALVELSYSHTVVATPMDVADTIGRWFPPPLPAAAPPPDIDADALIRAELGVVETPASEKVGSSRLTVRGTTPAMATDAAARAPGSDAGTATGPRPKVTFVRGEVGADGVPVWELTVAGDPAVVPPPAAKPARARRWVALAALAALVVVGGVVARGVGRGDGAATGDAELAVESSPAGARITLDGRAVDTVTPTTIHVARPNAGERHRLVLQLPGHRPWENVAVALQPGSRAFYRAQLEPLATRLVVHSDPSGADVDLDGRGIGRTPLAGLSVPADGGAHKLRLRHHGFLDEAADVTLVDRQDVVVERKLVPAPRFGTIDLHVEPWALVFLDGRQVGEAPIKGLSLPLGHHRLKLVNPIQHRQTTVAVDVPGKHAYRVRLP